MSYPRNDRTASISAGAGVIPRWRPTGRRVDCVGNPTPKAPGQLIPLKNVQTFLEKLHEKNNLVFVFEVFIHERMRQKTHL